MKMHFQVIVFRSKCNPGNLYKSKNTTKRKHISFNEGLDFSAARQEEAYFFSLFEQRYRKT